MIPYTQLQIISRYFSNLIEMMAFNNSVSYFDSIEYKYKQWLKQKANIVEYNMTFYNSATIHTWE